jgi:hypothetical protein
MFVQTPGTRPVVTVVSPIFVTMTSDGTGNVRLLAEDMV